MKYLIIFLILTGCGIEVEVDDIEVRHYVETRHYVCVDGFDLNGIDNYTYDDTGAAIPCKKIDR